MGSSCKSNSRTLLCFYNLCTPRSVLHVCKAVIATLEIPPNSRELNIDASALWVPVCTCDSQPFSLRNGLPWRGGACLISWCWREVRVSPNRRCMGAADTGRAYRRKEKAGRQATPTICYSTGVNGRVCIVVFARTNTYICSSKCCSCTSA